MSDLSYNDEQQTNSNSSPKVDILATDSDADKNLSNLSEFAYRK